MDEDELRDMDLAFYLDIARVANNELTFMLTVMRTHIQI